MDYEQLKIQNQLCFPMYACSKEIIKQYTPFLKEINLTYTQYITMLVMFEKKAINVKELGSYLFLDSGTLTPLLKKLEEKKFIKKTKNDNDERFVIVEITEEGLKLREEALNLRKKIESCINLNDEEMLLLYRLLYKILGNFEKGENYV